MADYGGSGRSREDDRPYVIGRFLWSGTHASFPSLLHGTRAVATVRVAGDLDVAEECVLEAYVSALQT